MHAINTIIYILLKRDHSRDTLLFKTHSVVKRRTRTCTHVIWLPNFPQSQWIVWTHRSAILIIPWEKQSISSTLHQVGQNSVISLQSWQAIWRLMRTWKPLLTRLGCEPLYRLTSLLSTHTDDSFDGRVRNESNTHQALLIDFSLKRWG